jgi:apolipoprotein N-acyltransferase
MIVYIALSVLLMSLAFAPIGQWYLAWVALAPWLVAVGKAPTVRSAFFRGWLGGAAFFAVNLWWLWTASISGTVVLVIYLGLYWGIAGGLIRAFHLLDRTEREHAPQKVPHGSTASTASIYIVRIFSIAVVWVAVEWLRCHVASGLPWLPLGVTQTPFILMCQVADFGGPWLVSFWVILPNALAALAWIHRDSLRELRVPAVPIAGAIMVVAIYGVVRLQFTPSIPGPRVMVLQSNFPHRRGGAPTVERHEVVDYFLRELEQRLTAEHVDLVILPEAAFPPINDEARFELAKAPVGAFLETVHQRLLEISRTHETALLVGGTAVTGWTRQGNERIGGEIRNSAYFIDSASDVAVRRYDKINLVRFSERAPLTIGPEWARRAMLFIAASRASQPMFAGSLHELDAFPLSWHRSDAPSANAPIRSVARFIAPICLENIQPRVIARMMHVSDGREKRG